jgi:hypothetical protein
MVKPNLLLCILLSALAAIFTIIGKVVVLHMARRGKALQEAPPSGTEDMKVEANKPSNTTSSTALSSYKRDTILMMVVFVVSQILANAFMFVAPWFGAVSIYWPCYVASQLLANMLIVGTLLQHERFDKAAQVATLVVVTAVLYITLCGPFDDSPAAEPLSIDILLSDNWIAVTWLGFLSIIFVTSFGYMLFVLYQKKARDGRPLPQAPNGQEEHVVPVDTALTEERYSSPAILEFVLLLVSTTCSVLSATASKAASTLPHDSPARPALMSLTWVIILAWSVENYAEGRYVERLGRFLPCMTLGSIVLNALTGLIVWQDAKLVTSWVGYATALALLGMGVYLISDLDFFHTQIKEQQEYLRSDLPYWHDVIGDLQDELRQAHVHECLPRHQRILMSYTRSISDPELGTRRSDHSVLGMDGSTIGGTTDDNVSMNMNMNISHQEYPITPHCQYRSRSSIPGSNGSFTSSVDLWTSPPLAATSLRSSNSMSRLGRVSTSLYQFQRAMTSTSSQLETVHSSPFGSQETRDETTVAGSSCISDRSFDPAEQRPESVASVLPVEVDRLSGASAPATTTTTGGNAAGSQSTTQLSGRNANLGSDRFHRVGWQETDHEGDDDDDELMARATA